MSGPPVVRLAGRQDMPAVHALRHEVFVLGQDVPADLERDALDDAAAHAVAVSGGRVVGTGRLVGPEASGRTDGFGTVGRMAVEASARGTGTGSALLAALEGEARAAGLRGVELHAQVHARRFYERAGYAALGATYLEAGIEHVTMRKAI